MRIDFRRYVEPVSVLQRPEVGFNCSSSESRVALAVSRIYFLNHGGTERESLDVPRGYAQRD